MDTQREWMQDEFTRVLNNSQWEEYIVTEHRAELITEDQPSVDNIIATGEDS